MRDQFMPFGKRAGSAAVYAASASPGLPGADQGGSGRRGAGSAPAALRKEVCASGAANDLLSKRRRGMMEELV